MEIEFRKFLDYKTRYTKRFGLLMVARTYFGGLKITDLEMIYQYQSLNHGRK
jgi:hypothetical protein